MGDFKGPKLTDSLIRELPGFKGETAAQEGLFAYFGTHDIAARTYAHPAIFTVDEGLALNLPAAIDGQHGKSLFLTTPKGELWLVVACEETRVDLKGLAATLGVKRFSFAKPELMKEVLSVTPGSATPFALLNDGQGRVQVVIETKFQESEECVFHPLDNRFSTVIRFADLLRFIKSLGIVPHLLPLA